MESAVEQFSRQLWGCCIFLFRMSRRVVWQLYKGRIKRSWQWNNLNVLQCHGKRRHPCHLWILLPFWQGPLWWQSCLAHKGPWSAIDAEWNLMTLRSVSFLVDLKVYPFVHLKFLDAVIAGIISFKPSLLASGLPGQATITGDKDDLLEAMISRQSQWSLGFHSQQATQAVELGNTGNLNSAAYRRSISNKHLQDFKLLVRCSIYS